MGIERYRAIVRLEEIRSLMEQGEYDAAKQTADSIRKERLRDSADLFLLASVYRKSGEFETAKEFLLRIYEKKVTWRVLEELMEVCLAEKNPDEAEMYFKQYVKLSGGDPRNYIYEYRIGRQKHRPDEELLPVLQTLKAEEYTEKYAYELAKLYHKLGRGQECMAECADLILWFGEGTYVERAKALQAYYRGELSAEDIRLEAERRIRGAEERRLKEEEEVKRPEAEEQSAAKEEGDAEVPSVLPSHEIDEALAEVAASDMGEPMWEKDDSVLVPEEAQPERFAEEQTEEQTGDAAYEQISLFVPQEDTVQQEMPEMPDMFRQEIPSKPQVLSPLGRELSARLEERDIAFEELLHEFARIERVRKQLVRMLEVVVTVRKKCHCLIITGEKKSGKTTLGTYLAKLLYELSYVKSPRVAKISAERLNRIHLNEKKEQLQDVCLIVESAGDMTEETAEALVEFVRHTDVLGAVILEDTANAVNRLLRNHAECNREFNNRVHLPKYDSSELMEFALGHIKEQDYEIDREARELLKQNIEYITRVEQKEGRLAATMELVKSALKHADERNQGTILAMASAGNFHAAEALELTAEDFGIIR